MQRSRSPASSCCTAFGRDSSNCDVSAFKIELHLQSGTQCFEPEPALRSKDCLLVLVICTRALLRAIDMLRNMVQAARPSLPKSAPTGFVRERWARHVLPGGAIDRRYYELCVLSEVRDRLRAGDVWVVGSRRYRSFEERLISRETQQELQQSGTLPIAVDADFERFVAGRRRPLASGAVGGWLVAR